jgi:hypothetical protein
MEEHYIKVSGRFSASLMSNAKWRKLFVLVARADLRIVRATWRFIDSENTMIQGLPREDELCESRFRDGRFQPFEYKWILSIEIPREYRPVADVGYVRHQPVEKLIEVLGSAGKFPLEQDDAGVTIVAYKR